MMPLSILMVLLWSALALSRDAAPIRYHWPLAWGLIATGVPLLGGLTLQYGPVAGLACLALGACLFRWPLLTQTPAAEPPLLGRDR